MSLRILKTLHLNLNNVKLENDKRRYFVIEIKKDSINTIITVN